MARSYGSNANFKAEARNYDREEYQALSQQQQAEIQQIKAAAGWINGYTPPPGFTLDNRGFATPSTSLVSAVQAHISATATGTRNELPFTPPPLPPVPFGTAPPIPPVIETNPHQAGAAFGRRGSRQPPSTDASIGQVSINGRSYAGSIYDANGNRIA